MIITFVQRLPGERNPKTTIIAAVEEALAELQVAGVHSQVVTKEVFNNNMIKEYKLWDFSQINFLM